MFVSITEVLRKSNPLCIIRNKSYERIIADEGRILVIPKLFDTIVEVISSQDLYHGISTLQRF